MQPVFCQLRHTPLSGLSVVIDGRIFTRHMDVFFLFTENEHVKTVRFPDNAENSTDFDIFVEFLLR